MIQQEELILAFIFHAWLISTFDMLSQQYKWYNLLIFYHSLFM